MVVVAVSAWELKLVPFKAESRCITARCPKRIVAQVDSPLVQPILDCPDRTAVAVARPGPARPRPSLSQSGVGRCWPVRDGQQSILGVAWLQIPMRMMSTASNHSEIGRLIVMDSGQYGLGLARSLNENWKSGPIGKD